LKAFALVIALALVTLAGAGRAGGQEAAKIACPDRWLARDKASHLALSAALVGFGYHLLRYERHKGAASSRNLAVGLTLGLGLSKEARDASRPDNHFSYKDLAADLLGAGLGVLIFTTK
jgi:putative lipoprotein